MDRPPDDLPQDSDRIPREPQIRPAQDSSSGESSNSASEPRRQPSVESGEEPDLNSDFLAFTPRTFEFHFDDGTEVIDLLRLLVGLPPQMSQKPSARALRVLKPVRFCDIPEGEQHCNVCYEEFEDVPERALSGYLAAKAAADANETLQPSDQAEWYSHEEKDDDHYALEMPCGHKFGRGCLVTWLDTSPTCPLCRQKLETEFEAQHPTQDGEQPTRDFLLQEYERLRPPHIWVRTREPTTTTESRTTPDPDQDGERLASPRPMVVHFYPAGLASGTYERPSPQSLRRFQRMVMQRAAREAFGTAAPGTAMRPPGPESPATSVSTPSGMGSQPSPQPIFGPERPPSGLASSQSSPGPMDSVPAPVEPIEPPAETPSSWRLSPWLDRGLVGFYTFYQHVMPGSGTNTGAGASAGPGANTAAGAGANTAAGANAGAGSNAGPSADTESGTESGPEAGQETNRATSSANSVSEDTQSDNSSRRGPQRHGLRRNHPYH